MKKIKRKAAIPAAAGLLAAVFFAFVYQCPFRLLFGVDCPCCGLRRAFLAAARLDFAAAFGFYPLWWLFALFFAYLAVSFFLRRKRNMNAPDLAVTLSVIAAACAVWLIRLLR